MALPSVAQLKSFLSPPAAPCVSIYLPTHRHHPENQQDRIRYKNLLNEVAESLAEKYAERQSKPLMDRLKVLVEDSRFWQHTLDGLAVLAAADEVHLFTLRRKLPERVVVADSFHIKPLLRAVQSADRFQVLGITREKVSFFEGDRYGVDPVELVDFPATLTDALGEETTDPHHGAAVGPTSPAASSGTANYGHGSRKDEIDKDTPRFFRVIDREVADRFSKPSGLPLVLAGLPENLAEFHKVAHNPHLQPDGVPADPNSLDRDQLLKQVWQLMEPRYLQRLGKIIDDFQTAQSRERGSSDLSTVARAANEGRVGRLLIDADKVIAGRINRETGGIENGELHDPETDDLLDDLAELVLSTGGEVIVVPSERMPTQTGLAAIFRF